MTRARAPATQPADPQAHLRQLDASTKAAERGARGVALTLPQGTGVEHVLVGGTEVVRAGAYTEDRPGTFLRSGRHTETAPIA